VQSRVSWRESRQVVDFRHRHLTCLSDRCQELCRRPTSFELAINSAHRFDAEVAAIGNLPLIVLLLQQS
jgi:hypothetical protein